jgi:hypothetical protein
VVWARCGLEYQILYPLDLVSSNLFEWWFWEFSNLRTGPRVQFRQFWEPWTELEVRFWKVQIWTKVQNWTYPSLIHQSPITQLRWQTESTHFIFGLMIIGPVSRLEKDQTKTGPRLEKTGPAVQSFGFWDLESAKRPV